MPKVKGPMLSLAASGTFRNLITFVTTASGALCRSPPQDTRPPTAAQTTHRAKLANAVTTWNLLSTAIKADWQACGVTFGMSGYNLFWREYVNQSIEPPDIPVNPCA